MILLLKKLSGFFSFILVFVYSVLLKIINFADVFLKYSVQCELVKNDSEIVTYCELMDELFQKWMCPVEEVWS